MAHPKSATDVDKEIGARVRTARRSRNLSQEKFGDMLSLTFQQVQKYEKGTNRITASRMLQISGLLGCSILWLYGIDQDTGEVPTPSKMLADKIARLPLADQRQSIERIVDIMLGHAAPTSPAVE